MSALSNVEKKQYPQIPLNICSVGLLKEFPRDSKTNSNQPSKISIGVRVIGVLLYHLVAK